MSKRDPSGKRWGYERAVWDVARAQLTDHLILCAQRRGTASYSELCDAIAVDRFRPYSWSFMALLDEACRAEDTRTGVILATLAVRKDSGRPGEGYFSWAEKAGVLRGDREQFWLAAAEAVWAAYEPAPAAGVSDTRSSCHTEALPGRPAAGDE